MGQSIILFDPCQDAHLVLDGRPIIRQVAQPVAKLFELDNDARIGA
jgi:hypothetical protein